MKRFVIWKNRAKIDDKPLITFILTFLAFRSINILVEFVFNGSQIWEILNRVVLGILFIWAAIYLFKTGNLKRLLIPEAFCLIILIFSYVLGGIKIDTHLSKIIAIILGYLPMGIFVYCITDYKDLLKRIYWLSWPILILNTYVAVTSSTSSINYYNMPVGYSILLPTLVFYYFFFYKKKKILDLIGCMLGSLVILLYGSRGPLLCILALLVFMALSTIDFHNRNKLIQSFFWIGLFIVFAFFYREIIAFVLQRLKDFGLSSRNIRVMLDNLSFDSGRKIIYSYFIERINEKPLLGWGLMGGWTKTTSGGYPHNILIEFVLSFGYPIGVIISVAVMILYMQAFLSSSSYTRDVAIIFISFSVCLFYSESFVESYFFYISIGASIKCIVSSKNKNKQKTVLAI
jgi:hypothetical protein